MVKLRDKLLWGFKTKINVLENKMLENKESAGHKSAENFLLEVNKNTLDGLFNKDLMKKVIIKIFRTVYKGNNRLTILNLRSIYKN